MIIKSLIILSIIFHSIGAASLSDKFDSAVVRNLFQSKEIAAASSANDIRLPMIVQRPHVKALALDPNICAKNYILVDMDSGKTLSRQAHKDQVPIASTTKIMSAIVVLENYKLNEIVTISPTAANMIGATANFRVGERITVGNLLKAMLIKSANGAAYALAEHMNEKESDKSSELISSENSLSSVSNSTGGNISNTSEEGGISATYTVDLAEKPKIAKFIFAMNKKAKELGMNDTEYQDPAGLDTTGYSTAYDLYLATKYALANETFAGIVKTNHDAIKNIDGTIWHQLDNSNRLIGEYQYPGAIGVKTGYMPESGHVLVSAAKREGHTLIGVVINTYADTAPASADESRKLLNWGFANTSWE